LESSSVSLAAVNGFGKSGYNMSGSKVGTSIFQTMVLAARSAHDIISCVLALFIAQTKTFCYNNTNNTCNNISLV